MIEQKNRDPKKAKYFLVSTVTGFIIFSLKSHEIKTYQTKKKMGRFDICAFDCNAEPKLLKEDLF